MSFRELSAWLSVVTTIGVWGYYFLTLLGAFNAGTLNGDATLKLFIGCMIATIVVQVALNIVASIISRQDSMAPLDEREWRIDARATKIGILILEWLMLAIALSAWTLSSRVMEAFPADPGGGFALVFGNIVVLAVVFTETVRELAKGVQFRIDAVA